MAGFRAGLREGDSRNLSISIRMPKGVLRRTFSFAQFVDKSVMNFHYKFQYVAFPTVTVLSTDRLQKFLHCATFFKIWR